MSKKRVDVDMGSMILPAGEDRLPHADSTATSDAKHDLVLRFRSAMGDPRGRVSEEGPERLPSPFSLLGAPQPLQLPSDPSEIGAAIEHLWVNHGAVGVREVRLKLSASLLPDTTVRLFQDAGRLRIDLNVGCEETLRWLSGALPALAPNIGERLRQPLCITVGNRGRPEPAASVDWEPGRA